MSWVSKAIHGDTSSIAKIGGIVAAPFTGGASLALTGAAIVSEAQTQNTKAGIDAAKELQATQIAAANNGQRNVSSVYSEPWKHPAEQSSSGGNQNMVTIVLVVAFAFLVFFLLKRK